MSLIINGTIVNNVRVIKDGKTININNLIVNGKKVFSYIPPDITVVPSFNFNIVSYSRTNKSDYSAGVGHNINVTVSNGKITNIDNPTFSDGGYFVSNYFNETVVTYDNWTLQLSYDDKSISVNDNKIEIRIDATVVWKYQPYEDASAKTMTVNSKAYIYFYYDLVNNEIKLLHNYMPTGPRSVSYPTVDARLFEFDVNDIYTN